MRILFIGDVVGKGGRKAVMELVPKLREELDGIDFVIVNGENMAGGGGFTPKCIRSLLPVSDVITGGDHMWDQKDYVPEADHFPTVLRPANVCASQPGRGYGIFEAKNGVKVGVVCLLGRTFMATASDSPFEAADRIVCELRKTTPVVIVDMHAEATSEKIAMGRYLDGRVSAVLGTHTHVTTADETVLPGGTAYQTDIGMVGARESILGRDIDAVLHKFSTGMPARFSVVEAGIRLHATMIDVESETGKATGIKRIVRDADSAAS
jgi:metallophosphoesterase (TIGR00282 family)